MRITKEMAYINKPLQNDNVFVTSEVVDFAALTGMKVRKGYEKAIISEGEIVNIVSDSYGHLPNENYFMEVETKLIDAGVEFNKRSINKNNRSFAVDYILNDESYVVKVKGNQKDKIVPMLRFTNSYDGSNKTTGHFGFFREICTNGLHIAQTKVGFGVRHSGNIEGIVLPEIDNLIETFFSNEYYQLSKKFEVLGDCQIKDLDKFVKAVADKTKVFKFEKSDKNPDASLNATTVMDTIRNEAAILGTNPNLWLGYNAFNAILHDKFDKGFEIAKNFDTLIFNSVLEMAN